MHGIILLLGDRTHLIFGYYREAAATRPLEPYLNGLRQSAWNALWLANNADSCLRQQKKRNSRQNFQSAASLILMSMPPKPPERLAEILQEILALSDSRATSQSESASGSDPTKNSDAHGVEEQSQRRDEEDKNRRAP
jgi:hypothetical protein